jgi:glucokinase
MTTKSLNPQIIKALYRSKTSSASQLMAELGVYLKDLNPALRALDKAGFIQKILPASRRNEDSSYSLREQENCVIGFDLGGTKLFGAITDLGGNFLYEEEIQDHKKTGEACFELLVSLLHSLLDKAQAIGANIRGIGGQVPGRVKLESGLVLNAPAVKWKEFPIKERLVREFGLPVFVDNDLKQSALGEAWFGIEKEYCHVALVAIGTGIAAGVVDNDELQRGAHLRHGEIGWMVPGREFLGRTYSGYGPFETEIGGQGIAKRACALLAGQRSEIELASLTSEDVFSAARKGEDWAKSIVDETVEYLAI